MILPARFPNLLVNGSAGIAVGMATNIPPHNLREVADGVQWALAHPDATREELLDALLERIKGPDFPMGALIVGQPGHRGGLPHRSRLGHDARGRRRRRGRQGPHHASSITELPYQVNPDNLALKIAELADSGKIQGIADVRDDTSGAHRPAPGRRAQARRRRPGRAQQPVQAHRAADELLLQHAGARRRRAAHADPRPVRLALGRPPDRGHPAPDPLPAAQGRGAGAHLPRPGQGARRARRGHRADPAQPGRRRGPRGPDGAARHRRPAGPRDPRHAAAPARRPGAAEDHRRARRARDGSSPTSRTSSPARSGSGRSSPTSSPRSSTSSATSGAARSSPPTATCRWRT